MKEQINLTSELFHLEQREVNQKSFASFLLQHLVFNSSQIDLVIKWMKTSARHQLHVFFIDPSAFSTMKPQPPAYNINEIETQRGKKREFSIMKNLMKSTIGCREKEIELRAYMFIDYRTMRRSTRVMLVCNLLVGGILNVIILMQSGSNKVLQF